MKKISKSCFIASVILSLSLIVGCSIQKYQTLFILFRSFFLFFKTMGIFLILMVVFYVLLSFLFKKMNHLKDNGKQIYHFIFEEHPVLVPFLCFVLVGIPIVLFFYPGPIQWDALKQLDYYSGMLHWSNHHPIFSTFLMGSIQKFGSFFINDNFGIFLYNFLQFLFQCFVFANIFGFMKKINAPKMVRILSFLFFLSNPVWSLYGYTLMKDTLHYLVFILFFIYYLYFYYYQTHKIPLLITAILLILLRNNEIYVVILSFLGLSCKKNLRKVSFCYIASFIVVQILLNLIISHYDIYHSNIRETLSVPIQQTARYIQTEDLTSSEKEILESTFHHDIQTIKEKYNLNISDPVKFMFNVNNNQELVRYLKVWFSGLLKRPDIYIDATLNHTYGYFYPLKEEVKDNIAYFGIEQNKRVNKGNFDFYMLEKYENQRKKLENDITFIRKLPILGLVYNTGTYFFVLIIFVFYAMYKGQKDKVLLSIPLWITFLFCLLSPVNAYLRYMYPIIFSLPVYFGLVTSKKLN